MLSIVNGAETYHEVHGSGKPVVLIHDRASTHEVWAAQLPVLAAGHQVVVFDSRGVGRSELGRPDGYTVELLADDVVALLDQLQLERATLVGISMGGGVAQMCALRYPSRVAALVLVSTSPSFSDPTRARMLAEADQIERRGISRELAASMTSRWFSAEFAAAHPATVAAVRAGVESMAPEVLAARSRANAARDFADRLAEIACPVLFVAGARDPMGPAHHAAVYSGAIENLEVHMIEGSSHLVPIEAAVEFNRVLLDFLARRV